MKGRTVVVAGLVDIKPHTSALSAAVETVRAVLLEHGVSESRAGEQEGFFITVEGRDEVSLLFNAVQRDRSASYDAAAFQEAKDALFKCCNTLAERGYPVTLIMSVRTLALYVRWE